MKTAETSPAVDPGSLSRREFFATAGASAGAFAALGGIAGVTAAPVAQAALKSRRYYSHHVALELNGQYAGLVELAEGGEPVLEWSSTLGRGPFDRSTLRYEPIRIRLSDMSADLYAWIAAAANGDPTPRSGAIVTANQSYQESYRLSFVDARLVEIWLDELDISNREPARFTLLVVPASSKHLMSAAGKNYPITSVKARSPLRSNFRLFIQGLEASTTQALSVDPVGLRGPQVVQTVDEFRTKTTAVGPLSPVPLKFQLPLQHAGPLYQWMDAALAGRSKFLPGELQLLDPTLSRVAASVSFEQLAIVRVSYPAQARDDRQLVDVECLPGRTTLNPGDLVK